MTRKPMNFNEARDIIMEIVFNKEFKTDQQRAAFLHGLKLGITTGRFLQDNDEVEIFIKAIDLHLQVFELK